MYIFFSLKELGPLGEMIDCRTGTGKAQDEPGTLDWVSREARNVSVTSNYTGYTLKELSLTKSGAIWI